MKYFFFFLCFLYFFNLVAQTSNDLSQLSYNELDSLMLLNYYQGNYQGTIPYLLQGKNKALRERAITKSPIERANIDSIYAGYIGNLGTFYFLLGEQDKAATYFAEHISLVKKLFGENHDAYANATHNLADFHRSLGNYKEAEVLYLQAIDVKRNTKGKQDSEYAIFLNNLGLLYWKMSQYSKAEGLYLEAEAINLKNLGEQHPQSASVINNLALLYNSMKAYHKAEICYLKSKKIKEATIGTQHPDYAVTLKNLANLYNETKRYNKAAKFYEEALQIIQEIYGDKHPRYASALNDLAFLYSQTQRYQQAEALYTQSLEIIEINLKKQHPFYALTLNNIALLHYNKGENNRALAYNLASIAAIADSFEVYFPNVFNDPSNLNLGCQPIDQIDFSTLSKLTYRNLSKIEESLQTLLRIAEQASSATKQYQISKAAIDIHTKVKNDFTSEENKLYILSGNTEFARYGIDAAYALGTNYWGRAFEFAEQNKSVLLREAIQGHRAKVLGDIPDSLAQREVQLSKRKDALKKQKYQTLDAEKKAAVISEENDLNQEISFFLRALKKRYPRYYQLKYEDVTAQVDEIQRLLAPETMLLEYFVSDTSIYLFAITATSAKLLKLEVTKMRLYNEVKRLRLALSNYAMLANKSQKAYQLYTQKGYWCYANLLEPALKGTNVKQLIVVADAVLGHIPFETFLTEDINQKKMSYEKMPYLLKMYTISYHYSATLWKENLKVKKQNNNHQLLACAASYSPLETTKIDSNLSKWRTASTLALREDLSPLPKAKDEVEVLAKKFAGDFKFGAACNEAFFKANANQYGIIHLAMHGVVHPQIPILSSLVFTENGDSLEDNLLQAHEIAHLQLQTDLVVLSACETGYGKYERGDGIRSLARSFMYAGVPSMVVSLWQVNDYSTAQVMTSFYDYLAKGLPKDKALQRAKLDYVKNNPGITAHPAFWSPFIQLGSNSPIQLARSTNWYRWGGGALIFLLLSSFWIYRRRKRD